MAPQHGTFAYFLSRRYRIEPDRVTIEPTRYGWVPAVMIVVGVVLLAVGLNHLAPNDDPLVYLIYAGAGTIVAGVLVLKSVPSGGPGRVVCTPDGVDWGGTHHALGEIAWISTHDHTSSGYSRNGSTTFYDWNLWIQLASGPLLDWEIVSTSSFRSTAKARVEAVVAAMKALVERAAADEEVRLQRARDGLRACLEARTRAIHVARPPLATIVAHRAYRLCIRDDLEPGASRGYELALVADGAWTRYLECFRPDRARLSVRDADVVVTIEWDGDPREGGPATRTIVVRADGTVASDELR